MSSRYLLSSRADTYLWGREFGAILMAGDVVALIGDLGAGKTTLVQAIAAGLGVTDPVSSPTFTLVQEYGGPTPVFHIDPYRLDEPEEMELIGFYEYLERDGVTIIEWADKIVEIMPAHRYEIELDIVTDAVLGLSFTEAMPHGDSPRVLTLKAIGTEQQAIIAKFASKPTVAALRMEIGERNE